MAHTKLHEIFDIPQELAAEPPTTTAMSVAVPSEPLVPITPEDTAALADDVQRARQSISGLIKDTTEAAKTAILLAQSGDNPKAFEVVATMLTAIVNANKELVNLHQAHEDVVTTRQKRIAPTGGSSAGGTGGVTIERAVFVGKSSDLLRELRQLSKAAALGPAIDAEPVESGETPDEH